MDKYDIAIQNLTLLDDPREILDAWGTPKSRNGCLFDYAGRTSTPHIGCLTQIRSNVKFHAETPELTEKIRNDKRIPKYAGDIKLKDLPVFAEWQRRLDKELPSRQTKI